MADERWVLARETVIEVPGNRPELGYTVFSGLGYFPSFEAVSAAIKEVGLPLGWVAMRTTQDPWNLLFPEGAKPSVSIEVRDECSAAVQKAITRFHQALGEREYDSWFPIVPDGVLVDGKGQQ